MLNSTQAWSAGFNIAGQYMDIDAGHDVILVAVATQGRALHHNQRVTLFDVEARTDGENFTTIGTNFSGNFDQDTIVVNAFAPLRARYVRFVVREWSGWISIATARGAPNRKLLALVN